MLEQVRTIVTSRPERATLRRPGPLRRPLVKAVFLGDAEMLGKLVRQKSTGETAAAMRSGFGSYLEGRASSEVTGFPGSAGVVEGVVRVLASADDSDRLRDGEVLVTTVTNVGWTPLFPAPQRSSPMSERRCRTRWHGRGSRPCGRRCAARLTATLEPWTRQPRGGAAVREALVQAMPPGGWTTDDLDRLPVGNIRYELTDGALTVSPFPSNLHQAIAVHLATRLEELAPADLAVATAVEIRFSRELTRIPDVMIVRSHEPGRHWFSAAEVRAAIEIESPGNHIEDRTTKPAVYARFGIGHYWRVEPETLRVTTYQLDSDRCYQQTGTGSRLSVTEPYAVDLPLVDLLPRWAR